MAFRVFIPGNPAAWQRARYDRRSRRFFPEPKTERAEKSLAQFAAEAMGGRALFDGPLLVVVDFAFLWPVSATKKRKADPWGAWKETRPDIDNLAKAVKDALNGVVWVDDAHIAMLAARKFYSDRPGTTVSVARPGEMAGVLAEPPQPWETARETA